MKKLIFISSILIILLKTGNVLSNTNIFNVNNIEISKDISQNQEKLVNLAFKKAYLELIGRLLLNEDYKKLSKLNLKEIEKLISYYQIINLKTEKNNIKINVFFDKDKMHSLFFNENIKYSDIINSEIILFPLFKNDKQYFIYTQNYFYDNWNKENSEDLIQYTLPVENIENIQKINLNKDNIYKINILDFFKEYENSSVVFANIETKNNGAEIFLKTIIEGKRISKNISIKNNQDYKKIEFYDLIIHEIKKITKDLMKSQNLIDVRTPSFLNAEIKMNKKNNLIEFSQRLKEIELIDTFYVQKLNKDYVLIKIKYLGKIDKIINKLKNQNIDLKMIEGQWQFNIT